MRPCKLMRAAAGVPEPQARLDTYIYIYIYIPETSIVFGCKSSCNKALRERLLLGNPCAAFVIWLAVLYIARAGAVYLLDFMRTRPLGWDSLARLANRASGLRRVGVWARGGWRERRSASKPTPWWLMVFPAAAYSCVHTLCSATEVHIRFQVDR